MSLVFCLFDLEAIIKIKSGFFVQRLSLAMLTARRWRSETRGSRSTGSWLTRPLCCPLRNSCPPSQSHHTVWCVPFACAHLVPVPVHTTPCPHIRSINYSTVTSRSPHQVHVGLSERHQWQAQLILTRLDRAMRSACLHMPTPPPLIRSGRHCWHNIMQALPFFVSLGQIINKFLNWRGFIGLLRCAQRQQYSAITDSCVCLIALQQYFIYKDKEGKKTGFQNSVVTTDFSLFQDSLKVDSTVHSILTQLSDTDSVH